MDDPESLDTLFADVGAATDPHRSPFKFLDAYGVGDRSLFFGRDNEIRDLYARFYRSRVLLVYGESGTGKTSLIECGLRSEIPAEEALFVTVRTAQDPFEAVRRALQRVLGNAAEQDLDALLRAVVEQKNKILVLVFDQFEEFFLFQPARVRQAFARTVQGWLEQEGNCRLVIGLREEYLARASELEPYWPGLFHNRLWIRHLARSDAEAAIVGPCEVCGVALEKGLVPHILGDLSGGGSEVELPIFQVVFDSLYRKALLEAPEHPRLTLDAYQELGQVQTILGRFLEERVQSYGEGSEVARQILKALVTAEGTRQFGNRQNIAIRARQFGPELSDAQVDESLQRLIGDRLVREDPDQHWYELRHDALARQIRQWMSGLEQDLVDLRQTLENRLLEYQRHGRLLETDLLATLPPFENRLALRGELAELVELSKRRARRYKRLRFLAVATVFTIVMVFAVFSFVQWQEAKLQKAQAEANFRRASEAVDHFFTQVSESTLLNQRGSEPLRRQLLEKALNFYQDLAKQRAEDQEMQAELAAATFRTAKIRNLLGDHHHAEAAYRQAIADFTVLARNHPEAPEHQSYLARSYNNLGLLLGDGGDAAAAHTAYQNALALLERLARDHPEVPAYQSRLALSEHNLGILLSDGGDAARARAAYQKALNLQERLVQNHPGVPEYQNNLATSYSSLGVLLSDGGDAAAARVAYQKALDLRERLARDHPEEVEYQHKLAMSYNNLGLLLNEGGDTRAARAAYQKALDLQEGLARDHPEVPEYRSYLAESYNNLGILIGGRGGDPAGAREQILKASGIFARLTREFPEQVAYRAGWARAEGNLAWTELMARQPRAAIASASRGLDADPQQLWIRINLAHGYLFDHHTAQALAIYTENKDRKLPEGKTFAEVVLADFKIFRARGLQHRDMARIEQILREPVRENRDHDP